MLVKLEAELESDPEVLIRRNCARWTEELSLFILNSSKLTAPHSKFLALAEDL